MSQARFLGASGVATRGLSQVFGRGPDMVNLWRIDADTDELVWAIRLMDTVIGVAMGSGQLYAVAMDSAEATYKLYAIGLADGSVIWSASLTISGTGTVCVAADAAGNAYVTLGDSVGKYNSSGTLVGSFGPAGSPSFTHVSYDAGSDVLVGAGSGFSGHGLVKFNTSLTELATTGSDWDFSVHFAKAFYSGETAWDDVWSSMTDQVVGGWWFAPPEDEASLPPGYPPSAVGRVTIAWGAGIEGDLMFAVGSSAFVTWYEQVGDDYYFHIKRLSGATDALPVTEAWEYVFSAWPLLSDPTVNTHVAGGWFDGTRFFAATDFYTSPDVAGAVALTILSASDGSVLKQYRLGDASGLAGSWPGSSAIYGSGDDVYIGTTLAPRRMGVTVIA